MPATLITNIKQLVNVRQHSSLLRGSELATLPCIDNAYLLIEDDTIAGYGSMNELSTPGSRLQTPDSRLYPLPVIKLF